MWSSANFSGNTAGCLKAILSLVDPCNPTAYSQIFVLVFSGFSFFSIFLFTLSAFVLCTSISKPCLFVFDAAFREHEHELMAVRVCI